MYDETPYPPPWNDTPLDERLTLRISSEWFELERAEHDGRQWFELERAEHDGRQWTEGLHPPTDLDDPDYVQITGPESGKLSPWAIYHCSSARLEKTTCIEGPKQEIAYLLHAIQTWTQDGCKRWGFYPLTEDVGLVWSPRNSQTSTRVTRRALEALVAEQEAQCT